MKETRTRARLPRARAASIAATEAAKTFGRLVDRVREERTTFIIERGGKPVAQIGPADRKTFTIRDFVALLTTLPRADEDYLRAVEQAAARHNKPRVRRNPWGR